MPKYRRVNIIKEEKPESDTLETLANNLRSFNIANGTIKKSIEDTEREVLVTPRTGGNLQGKALFLSCYEARPEIVRDNQGELCLIFIKRGDR